MSNFELKPYYYETETLFRSVEHQAFDTLANLCKDDFGIVDIDPEGKNVIISTRQEWEDYTQRANEAEEFGDKGLSVQLEDMIADETGHTEETERILRDWPL